MTATSHTWLSKFKSKLNFQCLSSTSYLSSVLTSLSLLDSPDIERFHHCIKFYRASLQR